jgi:two-component system OmpR family sensor kinase
MSLRLRLLLGLLALVAIGLGVTDAITYLVLQSTLSQQINTEAESSANAVAEYLSFAQLHGFRPRLSLDIPSGSYGELIGPRGSFGTLFTQQGAANPPRPKFPAGFASGTPGGPTFTTVAAATGTGEFRVLEVPTTEPGVSLVLAIPLTSVDATLNQLRILEILVSAGVLLGMAGLAWWTVRLELRPLERIRTTARAIAGGDLSRRVDMPHPNTEVGQLAVSLNEMLSQIERAFDVSAASEARMRQFLADASHELRTPLSSIRGYAELFRQGARGRPADLDKAMSRIESESVRMTQLVDDLMLLVRLDEGRPLQAASFDISELAVEAAADASVADRHHQIRVDAPVPVEVVGDEPRIRQVVNNLVRNAMVHTPAGTLVEVSVREEDVGFALLRVVDHGPGVSEEAAARIFERFVRLDESRSRGHGSSGLGLAIVAAIVAAHHGTVRLETTPGGGATFWVRLPTKPLESKPGEPSSPTAPG